MASRKEDPRPLTSRPFIEESIQELLVFLHKREIPVDITEKQLRSPTTKDFQNVFTFLVSQSVPYSFNPDKTLVDNVTGALRMLSYPYIVSKSALSSVGSSHTWPSLLGVCTWLMQLAIHGETSYAKSEELYWEKTGEIDGTIAQKTREGYTDFLNGNQQIHDVDRSVVEMFQKRDSRMTEEMDEMSHKFQYQTNKLGELRAQPSPMSQVLAYRKELESNIKKFNILIPSMLKHRKAVQQGVQKKRGDVKTLEQALNELTLEKRRDIEVIDSQKSQSIHAAEILERRRNLQQGLALAKDEKNLIEDAATKSHETLKRVLAEAEILLKSARQFIEQLGAEANRTEFVVMTNLDAQVGQPMFPNLDNVIGALTDFTNQLDAENRRMQDGIIEAELESDVLEDKFKGLHVKVDELKRRLARYEKEFEKERGEMDTLRDARMASIAARKKEAEHRRNKLKTERRKLEDVILWLDNNKNEAAATMESGRKAAADLLREELKKIKNRKIEMSKTLTEFESAVSGRE